MWLFGPPNEKTLKREKIKKRIFLIALLAVLVFAFFYNFAPGWAFGGINYINEDSIIFVVKIERTRTLYTPFFSHAMFERAGDTKYTLNSQQIRELRHLLRNSWYTRHNPPWLTLNIPQNIDRYYDFHISNLAFPGENIISLHISGVTGYLSRSNYSGWLRIRNSGWHEELLGIIEER